MTANFTLFFAFYLLTPLLPLYLSETFGATKDMIGLVLSGYTITALLFRPFSGYMVDSFPRKKVLMVCFGAFSIFFAGYLAASTLLLFTIVRTLHGGPFGASTVANSTVAIDVLPSSRRTEGIGYYGLSNNLAMAIAPTIGIFIYKLTMNFELLFWIALVHDWLLRLGTADRSGQRPHVACFPEYDHQCGRQQPARHSQFYHPYLVGCGYGTGHPARWHHRRTSGLCSSFLVSGFSQCHRFSPLLPGHQRLLPAAKIVEIARRPPQVTQSPEMPM